MGVRRYGRADVMGARRDAQHGGEWSELGRSNTFGVMQTLPGTHPPSGQTFVKDAVGFRKQT